MNDRPGVLSEEQLAPPLPGAAQLTYTRWLILLERNLRLCWRFYCVVGVFLGCAWLDLFSLLPSVLHLLALALFTVAMLHTLWGTGAGWVLPSLEQAARRLEAANALPHYPYEALTAHPVNPQPNKALKTVWELHQARARTSLTRLRLPLPQLSIHGTDPHYIRLLTACFLVASLVAGRNEWGARLQRALTPTTTGQAFNATATQLTVWVTPPAYTGRPPLMLSEAGKPISTDTSKHDIPAGSSLALRLASSDSKPELMLDKGAIPFTASGTDSYSLDLLLPETTVLAVKRGWTTLARWSVRIIPDQAPQIEWAAPPSNNNDDVQLHVKAQDDYGLKQLQVMMKLAVSSPGLPSAPVILPLSGAGRKSYDGKNSLPLATHVWAGMPVTMVAMATDQAGQTGESASVTVTLPEHRFTDPLAQELATARRNLLHDHEQYWKPTIGLLLSAFSQPERYRGDPRLLLGLRSTAARMYLDKDHAQLTAVTTILWQLALALDTGGMAEITDKLRQAQQELEQALANKEDAATIQQKLDQMQQALMEYMQTLARTMPQETPDIPPDILEEAGKDFAEQMMQKAQEIQDLAQTGAHEAAAQKLRELQEMMDALHNAKPMTAEQQADMQALKNIRDLIKQQEKLQEATGSKEQQANQTPPLPDDKGSAELSQQQTELRNQLGKLVDDIASRHPEPPPQMATADQGMKESAEELKQQSWSDAKNAQGRTLKALKELSSHMKQDLQRQIMVLPSGSAGEAGERRNPFDHGDQDDNKGATGEVKIPDKQDVQRARQILDELRRRSGEYERPKDERNYIERLLDRF